MESEGDSNPDSEAVFLHLEQSFESSEDAPNVDRQQNTENNKGSSSKHQVGFLTGYNNNDNLTLTVEQAWALIDQDCLNDNQANNTCNTDCKSRDQG